MNSIETTSTDEWRARLTSYALSIAVVFGLVAFIPSVIISVVTEHWLVLGTDIAAYVVVVVLWSMKHTDFRWRAAGFIASVAITGATLLVALGPWGAGIAWSFAAIVLASLFFGLPGWIASSIVYVVTAVSMAVLVAIGRIDWPIGPIDWAVHATSVFAAASGVSLATHYLVSKVESVVPQLEALNNDLRSQHQKQATLLHENHHRVRNNLQVLISLSNLTDGSDAYRLARHQSRVWCLAIAHDLSYRDGFRDRVRVYDLITAVRDQHADMVPNSSLAEWCHVELSPETIPSSAAGSTALLMDELFDGWITTVSTGSDTGSSSIITDSLPTSIVVRFTATAKPHAISRFAEWVQAEHNDLLRAFIDQIDGELTVITERNTASVTITIASV